MYLSGVVDYDFMTNEMFSFSLEVISQFNWLWARDLFGISNPFLFQIKA
jgi:hypothetical protein